MLRRGGLLVCVLVALAAGMNTIGLRVPKAVAIPVASNDETYSALGRVFPDPQGCAKGTPGNSPWAKGNVCATQFLQWEETLAGLGYLQKKFPRVAELVNLRELKKSVPAFADLEMQSAGLPQADGSRAKRDLHVFKVTDRESTVPLADRHRFAFVLSIHGIERAGVEGGVRAAEELVTWAATAPTTRILEPTNSGPTAGSVLRDTVLYFVLANPDGWGRGELTKGGAYFQRYNGNGADVNRDFPNLGFANPVYTPESEPEGRGYAAYLLREKEASSAKRFLGASDLHGMNAADAFSYTMLAGNSSSWSENERTVATAEAIYRDAAKRLTYSPLIADPSDCPGNVPVFLAVSSGSAPMCPDQWGTVWDTINYQTTGSMGDWLASKLGLGATGVDNEMAFSHLSSNDAFNPFVEQLHVDGNKGIIYAQIAALTAGTTAAPAPVTNVVGYAPSVRRRVRGSEAPRAQTKPLPPQTGFAAREVLGQGVEFEVKGTEDGVHNGGMTAEFTFTNATGVSTESASDVVLERFGFDHPGEPEGWHEVGRWFRQELTYFPAGARIDVNEPVPGRYRLAPAPMFRHGVTTMRVRFSAANVVPQPNLPYDVANTDVFPGLGTNVRAITPAAVLADARALDGIPVYAIADDAAPGVAAADRAKWFAALKTYVTNGGTLVLTDQAVASLVDLGVLGADKVTSGVEYGGWLSFTDSDDAVTFGKSALVSRLDREGASSGAGAGLEVRRQTYDPGAVGYPISTSPSPNCLARTCRAPQVVVDTAAWRKAGGSVLGRAAVLAKPDAQSHTIGVGFGELPLGRGRVRIAGGLLPTPTQAYAHPYGLEGFGLSWTGWQVLVNLLSADIKDGPTPVMGVTIIPRTGTSANSSLDYAAIVVLLVAGSRMWRARRRAA